MEGNQESGTGPALAWYSDQGPLGLAAPGIRISTLGYHAHWL
jgi:hypothetical protein